MARNQQNDFTRLGCPGLGNLFYMAYKWFLVAYLSNRTFHISLPKQCNIGTLLQSQYFNWSFEDPTTKHAQWISIGDRVIGRRETKRINVLFGTSSLNQIFKAQVVIISADSRNTAPDHFLLNPAVKRQSTPLFQLTLKVRHGCIHRLLFSPAEELSRAVARHIVRAGAGVWSGVHVRLGDSQSGMVAKAHPDNRSPPRWHCAEEAVRDGGAYLAADSPHQVVLWKQRFGERVWTQKGVPKHTGFSAGVDRKTLLKVLVDFRVLCEAPQRFLTSRSSFSTEAFYCAFGEHSWTINHPKCEPYRPFLD
eukprot:EG_transcript_8933